MSNEIPVKNTGATMLFVGSTMIPPGETRILPDHHVPAHLRPVTEVEAPAEIDPIADLLAETVPNITAELPGLPDEFLLQLRAAEEASENPRSTLSAAIAEVLLKRASGND